MSRISLIHTTAFRLLMRYAGFVCLLAVLCFGIIYWVTVSQLHTQIDAGLRAEATALARLYELKGIGGLRQTIAALSTTKSLARSDTGDAGPRQYLLADAHFRPLAGSLGRWPPGIAGRHTAWATLRIRAPRNQPGLDADNHYFEMRAEAVVLPGGYHLLVGQSLDETTELRHSIFALTIAAIVLVLCVALAGGIVVGRSMLRRLQNVTRTADIIMSGDLSQRIPEERRRDEFDALVGKLNAMLARIEQLMQSTREVTENVAHDLRSPLTHLRSRAEMALMGSGGDSERRAALHKVIEETDGIVATLNAILSIARIEAGERREWGDVDLAAVCRDAAELYEAVAEDKDVRLEARIAGDAWVEGNRQLLAQAVGNLLDNAIKYTPAGGAVILTLTRSGSRIRITVADNGPGIPAGLRDKALQRFVRLEEGRNQPGNGLGLALVKAVGDQHGAELDLEDNHPGLRVNLSLNAKPVRQNPCPEETAVRAGVHNEAAPVRPRL